MALYIVGQPSGRKIGLQTRAGNDIDNFQAHEISAFNRNQFADFTSKYKEVDFRSEPSPIYNCHGLVFASRRTCIDDPTEIQKILKEDEYKIVEMKEAKPGDILVYWSDNGDAEHSALVISEPAQLGIPKVISKWGVFTEVIHYANISPYSFSNATCHRILK